MRNESLLDRLPEPQRSPVARLKQALELFEDAVDLKRCSLRRQYPTSSAQELEDRLKAWLQRRAEP